MEKALQFKNKELQGFCFFRIRFMHEYVRGGGQYKAQWIGKISTKQRYISDDVCYTLYRNGST